MDTLTGTWHLEPATATIEFRQKNFFGLMNVKGGFDRFSGTLDFSATPAAILTIEAASINTGSGQRDKHLRSKDFFHVDNHPEIRFESHSATQDDAFIHVFGQLKGAGGSTPLEFDAHLTTIGEGSSVEIETSIAPRALGITWNPLGMMLGPTTLIVRGRLTRAQAT